MTTGKPCQSGNQLPSIAWILWAPAVFRASLPLFSCLILLFVFETLYGDKVLFRAAGFKKMTEPDQHLLLARLLTLAGPPSGHIAFEDALRHWVEQGVERTYYFDRLVLGAGGLTLLAAERFTDTVFLVDSCRDARGLNWVYPVESFNGLSSTVLVEELGIHNIEQFICACEHTAFKPSKPSTEYFACWESAVRFLEGVEGFDSAWSWVPDIAEEISVPPEPPHTLSWDWLRQATSFLFAVRFQSGRKVEVTIPAWAPSETKQLWQAIANTR